MSNKRKGQLTVSGEWHRHLRPVLRRAFWKGERQAENAQVRDERETRGEFEPDATSDVGRPIQDRGFAMSTPTVTPGLLYHDAPQAIEWLCRVFGFQKRLVIPGTNGTVAHAHLTLGNGGVMLSSAEAYSFPGLCRSPREVGGIGTVEVIVYVADPDAHYARAVAEGAEIVIPIEDKPYGGRGYSCRDLEGHVWAFGSYNAWAEQ